MNDAEKTQLRKALKQGLAKIDIRNLVHNNNPNKLIKAMNDAGFIIVPKSDYDKLQAFKRKVWGLVDWTLKQ